MSITYSLYEPEGFMEEGDEWKSPKGHSPSFARVMCGGEWRNVDAHEGEDHVKQQEPRAETGRQSGEVSERAGESAPGDGNDGETLSESGEKRGSENSGIDLPEVHINPDSLEEIEIDLPEEGVDANGSPVI